jgi:signal transduction histidine kinase
MREIADCVKGLSAPPHFAPCKLAHVVKEVTETLSWLAKEKGISIETSGLDDVPDIVADERRLFNALYNLMNNAIPEVPRGGKITIAGKKNQLASQFISPWRIRAMVCHLRSATGFLPPLSRAASVGGLV